MDVPAQLFIYTLLSIVAAVGVVHFIENIVRSVKKKKICYFLSVLIIELIVLFGIYLAIGINKVPVSLPDSLPVGFGMAILISGIVLYLIKFILRKNHFYSLLAIALPILLVSLNSIFCLYIITKKNGNINEFYDTIMEIEKKSDSEYLVVGNWAKVILSEHYLFGDTYTPHSVVASHILENLYDANKKWNSAQKMGTEIWLMENYPSLFRQLDENGYKITPFRDIYYATKSKRN
ncbi:hypothetical protein DRQ33_04810 [bacterium]|nr:MAG: hypothetical protein DRQ33_04810 [bacterium]